MAAAARQPYAACEGGLRLSLRVVPNARTNHIDGLHAAADGSRSLKLRTTAQPEKGRANKAVIAFLAKNLHIRKSQFTLVSGQTDRNKQVAIEGNFGDLARAIDELCKAHGTQDQERDA